MPTYEYQCTECEHRFEEFQSISAKPLTKCPECNGNVQRLIGTGNGFLFKGSGFYITDYRSQEYKKDKEKDSGSYSAKKSSKKKSEKKSTEKKTTSKVA